MTHTTEVIEKFKGKVYTDSSTDDWPELALEGWSRIQVVKSSEKFYNGAHEYNLLIARRNAAKSYYEKYPRNTYKEKRDSDKMFDEILLLDHFIKNMFQD